jgi:uncharacterized damage-inducible protein DinB
LTDDTTRSLGLDTSGRKPDQVADDIIAFARLEEDDRLYQLFTRDARTMRTKELAEDTHMTVQDLERLYDYNYWANKKLLAAVSQLTPEQFTQTVAGSYGSVRNTLVHILSAEWAWLDRCGGQARGPALKADDYPTVESLVDRWGQVEGHVRAFLSILRDEDLNRTVEFTNPRGEKRSGILGALLQHGATHGVHHRGQVALQLRSLGYTPGNFDLLFYDAEKGTSAAW